MSSEPVLERWVCRLYAYTSRQPQRIEDGEIIVAAKDANTSKQAADIALKRLNEEGLTKRLVHGGFIAVTPAMRTLIYPFDVEFKTTFTGQVQDEE